MNKAYLFLVLAMAFFANAEAQENPMHEDTRKILQLVAQKDFTNAVAEGEAFLRNHSDLPDRNIVILVLARGYRCLGRNEESVKYYKIIKEVSSSQEPNPVFNNVIKEADQFIGDVERKQNNTNSTSLLGLTAEQLVKKYGSPESVIKERAVREKSPVSLGLSEVLHSPEFIYDNVFKFKRSTDSGNGGYILITCGLLNGKTVFIEYEDYDNPFYKGEAGSFDQDAMYLLIGKNLNTPTLKRTRSIKEDDRFKYYIEERSGSIVATQESSVTKSTAWIAIFSDEGWQAYRKFKMEYNNSGLNKI